MEVLGRNLRVVEEVASRGLASMGLSMILGFFYGLGFRIGFGVSLAFIFYY
jgi:hypothetical protein